MLVRPFYFCLGRNAHARVHVAAPPTGQCVRQETYGILRTMAWLMP